MSKERTMLNVRITNEMKKELKLVSVYEDTTVTELVINFISYGLRKYNEDKTLIK